MREYIYKMELSSKKLLTRGFLLSLLLFMSLGSIGVMQAQQLQTTALDPETGAPVPGWDGGEQQLHEFWQQRQQRFTDNAGQAAAPGLQNNESIELASVIEGGTSRSGYVEGDFAYFGDGPVLVIVDLSTPDTPQERGRISVPGLVNDVKVQGDFAYVASRAPGGFHIIDISDKDAPVEVFSQTNRGAFAIDINETRAFVGNGTQGLTRFDITTPEAAAELDFITTPGSANGISVNDSGDLLFVALGGPGAGIYDVSADDETTLIDTIELGGFVNGADFVDDFLYLSWADGYSVFDVSDPENPEFAGDYNDDDITIRESKVVGDLAYISGSFGLRILDVSDPSAITLVSSLDTGSSLHAHSDGNIALSADRFFGLNIVDVQNPEEPALLDRIDVLGFSFKVFVEDDILYIMDIAGKLAMYDIADPTAPQFLSRIETFANANNLYADNGLVYVVDANNNGAITIVDATDPANPVIQEEVFTGTQNFGIDIVDDRVYLAAGFSGGLSIFEQAPEGGVELLGNVSTANNAYYVRRRGDLGLVANFGGGLFIGDVSDDENPVALSSTVTGQLVQSLDFRSEDDGLVLLADGQNGLTTVDITDPENPEILGSQTVNNNARDVRVEGSNVYAASEFQGIRHYSSEDLETFDEISFFDAIDRVTGLALTDELLIGAGAEGNVYLFYVPGQAPEPEVAALQLIHNVADPAAALVDVFLNDELIAADVAYGSATAYLDVPAGESITLDINAAGTEQTLISETLELTDDLNYVATAVGVGSPDDFAPNPDGQDISASLLLAEDTRQEAVNPDEVDFFVTHTATDAPAVDVRSGELTLLENAIFGSASEYLSLLADSYDLELYPSGTDDLLAIYRADLSGLAGESAVITARGFLDPSSNQDGPAFELVAVLASGEVISLNDVTSTPASEQPREFALEQNYPNPFNPSTSIRFSLPEAGEVNLSVYNVQGQRVATLTDGLRSAGTHQISFDAGNLASGVYLYRLQTESTTLTRKMMLVK
jgi:hypothetical protein